MVKVRYRRCYPKDKVQEMEIRDVILKKERGDLALRYDQCIGYPGTHYSVLGTYFNDEGIIDFLVTLIINDTEYRAEWIRKHFAEVQVLLDQERMEKLLEEIDD